MIHLEEAELNRANPEPNSEDFETETCWETLLEEGPLTDRQIMEISHQFYELIDPLVGIC